MQEADFLVTRLIFPVVFYNITFLNKLVSMKVMFFLINSFFPVVALLSLAYTHNYDQM